jgi:SAM-dependent methyltransferase
MRSAQFGVNPGMGPDMAEFSRRFVQGERRAVVFRDIILRELDRLPIDNGDAVLLDIGCGSGFDNDPGLQRSLFEAAGHYVGVEPDGDVTVGDGFTCLHRCRFEEAPIDAESIDLAFAVMVIEHVQEPLRFWDKVHEILRPQGVFWGFTVDARHWFVSASRFAERLRIKDWYLDALHGKRGVFRYENYPACYRCNSPRRIHSLTASFRSTQIYNLQRVGQAGNYLPRRLRWAGRAYDRLGMRLGWPGSVLAVRVVK